jgi:hypothetical protein
MQWKLVFVYIVYPLWISRKLLRGLLGKVVIQIVAVLKVRSETQCYREGYIGEMENLIIY